MLSIVPSFKLADQKTELIFLVDRSGSMGGDGIEQAKRALTVYVKTIFTVTFYKVKLCLSLFFDSFSYIRYHRIAT